MTPKAAEVLRMEHITKQFGPFYANRDVNFDVRAGELNGEIVPEEVQEAYAEYIQQMINETFMAE